ncbi:PQQ-binding-like beta-propeller repeat protein [Lacipirellula parvula]|uniref:Putative serine/threonine protein kinase related protein n=1 Tax=Lacipirellula parvula TaxID=2650471 RepID=A0A5K7X9U3_9BACT|nr:PQQ-binding-like beta-propeller repeat protein [Lacipirellula parvula]BBO33494.1 putative serine/threonine protein kinase related protein [Lacipirellula parvula]
MSLCLQHTLTAIAATGWGSIRGALFLDMSARENLGKRLRLGGLTLTLALLAVRPATAELTADDWPSFRGGGLNQTAAKLPLDWSIRPPKNIAWTADLPGRGVSSPIVVAGRVIVTCSAGEKERELFVLAFDAGTGKELWRREFAAQGNVVINELTAVAANTPATDGERIYTLFSSNDMFVLDLDGKDVWQKDLTAAHEGLGNDFGMASSPVVVDGVVILQCNGETAGFVAAYDAATGELRWQEDRPNQSSWTSPYFVDEPDARGVIIQTPKGVQLLKPADGRPVWNVEMECDTIASSTPYEGRVYVPAKWLSAVELVPTEDPAEPVWEAKRLKPTSASPVIRDGKIYAINRGGVLNCFDLKTEEIDWTTRLKGSVWATPLLGPEHLYCFNAKGDAFVLNLKGEILAEINMVEEILASPAVSGNSMFVRSHSHLWKIAE